FLEHGANNGTVLYVTLHLLRNHTSLLSQGKRSLTEKAFQYQTHKKYFTPFRALKQHKKG
ncbi:MAG TPA: hypothetical protein DCG37_08060, partial [Lachnospiraceae bacterium]|nr:hypothetical protein [Lachnospiraceae bacterium]